MRSLVLISILAFLITAGVSNTCYSKDRSAPTVSREQIDKKYTFIEKNLGERSKRKLNQVTKLFDDSLRKMAVKSKDVDVHAMAHNAAKKLFLNCSDKQMSALVFHIVITSLKKMETKVEVMNQNFGHTSSVYNSQNLKAFLLFETGAGLYPSIKKLPASVVKNIP